MTKIKAVISYVDSFEGRVIKAGDVYCTTDERAEQIINTMLNDSPYAVKSDEKVNVSWCEDIPQKKRGHKKKNVE